MINSVAKWIWYANDFELLAYHKMTKRRRERKNTIYPTWIMDRPEYQVVFFSEYDIPEEQIIKIYHTGLITVNVNGKCWNEEYNDGYITLPKGKGSIRIYCLSENDMPTIFIDSKYLKTNEKWLVYCVDNKMINASTNDMFTTKDYSPIDYKLPTKKIKPKTIKKVSGGILYDFGKELVGIPALKADKNKTFNLFYGESELEALDYENSEVCEDIKSIANKVVVAPVSTGFRYIFVKNSKSLLDFFVYEEVYSPNFKPYFKSDDKKINQIYNVAKRTLEVTSREFFIDGPKRDRWVWAGDALQSAWFDFYTFFDKEIVKRTIRAIIGKQEIRSNMTGILDYNFYYILTVYYYFMFTGDKEFVKEIYPRLESLMRYIFTKPKVDGFLMAKNEWIFIDWTNIPNFSTINNKYPVCLIQILYYKSLQTMSLFEDILGKEKNPKYQEELDGLKDRINKTFYDEELGGYYHDAAHTLKTKYGNIFAILCDFADDNQKAKIAESMVNSDFYEIYTPFMKFFELCAIAETGNIDYVIDYMNYYWGGMIDEGATTFWEKYDPNQKGAEKYEMYGRKYGKSLCHSWGAGPLYLLAKYVVGLKPCDSGYQEYSIKPYLTNFKYSAKLPMNDSEILVDYNGEQITIYSPNKDGILICDDRFITDGLKYSKEKGGYILEKSIKHCIRIGGNK